MILDVEPEDDEDEDEDEEFDQGDNESGDGTADPGHRAGHSRVPSNLSIIESSAELLYGLVHQRFICSRAGIQQMAEKYEHAHFGQCPRSNCNGCRTLPVGLSDIPGEDTVKLFCPSCLDVYVPPNSRFQTVDGAFFGCTFAAIFLMTFPDYDVSKRATDVLQGSTSVRPQDATNINGVPARNLAPGLGARKKYEPRIYGFKVSERARNGPRMAWLRDRPDDVSILNEMEQYGETAEDYDARVAATGQHGNGASRGSGRRARAAANGHMDVELTSTS